jgi:DNA polymerase III alpha subunit
MESFSCYFFSKAHSASFAVESYQSLFLRTYYPMEFYVAVMNNNGGFYSKEVYYHELLKTGAHVLPPCVNNSDILTNIKDTTVHLGFYLIKDLENNFITAIVHDRNERGKYKDLMDFIDRLNPDLEQLNRLVRIGAFRFTGKNKKELLWEANSLHKKHISSSQNLKLFEEKPVNFVLPQLTQHYLDDALDEIELINFPLRNPIQLVDDETDNYTTAEQLKEHIGKTVTMLLYLVTIKESITKHKDMMNFGTFYDHKMQWVDTIHWPSVLKQYPLTGKGFYKITGKVTCNYGVHSIEVLECFKVGIKSKAQKANDLFSQIKDFKPGYEPLYQNVA